MQRTSRRPAPRPVRLLDWLEHPRPDTGMWALRSGAWEKVPYMSLAARSRRAAAALRAHGVGPGEVAALALSDPVDFAAAFFGTLAAGGTPSPLSPPLPIADTDQYVSRMEGILRHALPRVILTDPEHADLVVAARPVARGTILVPAALEDGEYGEEGDDGETIERRVGETALLQFTSGSSGPPRPVTVSADNLEANIAGIRSWLDVGDSDIACSWLPLHHDMGLVGMLLASVVGQTELYLMRPEQFVRNPASWLECLGRRGATITAAPTFGFSVALRRLQPEAAADFDMSGVRSLIVGAERVDAPVLRAFLRRFADVGLAPAAVRPAYGLAEATLAVTGVPVGREPTVLTCDLRRTGVGGAVAVTAKNWLGDAEGAPAGGVVSCGVPLPGVTVEVIDDAGSPLPDGHLGEIVVQGPSVAPQPPALAGTSADASGDVSDDDYTRVCDGRLLTGDVGFLHDGELYVVGRLGDSGKVSGQRVYAEDLEALLVAQTGLPPGRGVVLVGAEAPDEVVVLLERPGPTAVADTLAALRSRLGRGPTIRIMRVARGQIERTTSGKPRRRVIGRHLADGTLRPDQLHPPQPTAVTKEP